MTSKPAPPPMLLARGKGFLLTWKAFLDLTAQFGDNGQELHDSIPRKPVIPKHHSGTNSDGTWISTYALQDDKLGLSAAGQADFNFDRNQAASDLAVWNKNSRGLLQLMLNVLSPESKALLELKTGPTGYLALRADMNTLELGKLITETHLGASVRSKQQALQEFLTWRQTHVDFPVDLANFRTLLDMITLNFESLQHPGCITIATLSRMIFILGLDRSRFLREIENSYDQYASKTTAELMEICQSADLERGFSGAAATYSVAALAAPLPAPPSTKPGRSRPSLGPYPIGGSSAATCPHCWRNGYASTNHGVDHSDPTKRDCFHQKRSEANKKKSSHTSHALVSTTASMFPPGPLSVTDAQAFVTAYTTDGFRHYMEACKVAGIDTTEFIQSPAALVSVTDISALPWVRTDEELEDLQRYARSQRPTQILDSPNPPFSLSTSASVASSLAVRPLRQTSMHHFFSTIPTLDTSFGSMSVHDDTMDLSMTSDGSDIDEHILHLQQVSASVDAPPAMFSLSAHHAGVVNALAVADLLARRVEVQAGLDTAPRYSFGPSDELSSDSENEASSPYAVSRPYSSPTSAVCLSRVVPIVDSSSPDWSVADSILISRNLTLASARRRARESSVLELPVPSGRCHASAIVLDDFDKLPALVDDDEDDDDDEPIATTSEALPPIVSPWDPRRSATVLDNPVRLFDISASTSTSACSVPASVSPVHSYLALAAPVTPLPLASGDFHWDSCCSVNVTNNPAHLRNMRPLEVPVGLGGIGSGVFMTHVGDLEFLADYPTVSRGFFAADSSHNLLSLLYWQSKGFNYASTSPTTTVIWDPAGAVVDIAQCLPHHLLRASLPLTPAIIPSPPALESHYACVASYDAILSHWVQFRAQEADLVDGEQSYDERLQQWAALPVPVACVMSYDERLQRRSTSHFTAEQRARCDRMEAFHYGRGCHFSDDVLAEAFQNGLFPELELTARDVRDNRLLRGPCPNCLASKHRQQAMPPSHSEPASMPGEHLHIDIFEKTKKSAGGKSTAIRMSDDHTGDIQFGTATSKQTAHLFAGIVAMIHARYTVHGHRVLMITSDSDPALAPLIPLFKSQMQITLNLVSPGMHEHFIENRVGSQSGKIRAVQNSMRYILPAEYDFYTEKWVHDNANALPNSRSRPSTPDILVTGRRRKVHPRSDVTFGTTAIVFQSDQKRDTLAKELETTLKLIDPGEVGICLGFSDECPGDYLFLLDTGKIVPRRNVKPVSVQPTLRGQPLPIRSTIRSSLLPPEVYPAFDPILEPNEPLYTPTPPPLDLTLSASHVAPSAPVQPVSVSPPSVVDGPVLQTPMKPSSPVFNIHRLVDIHGRSILPPPLSPARSPAHSPVSYALLPEFSSPRPVAVAPAAVLPRRSARLQQLPTGLVVPIVDADGFTLVHRDRRHVPTLCASPLGLPIGLPRAPSSPPPIPLALPSAPRVLLNPRFPRLSKAPARSTARLDDIALDEAIAQSQQQFLAMVASATELSPFFMGSDEYLATDLPVLPEALLSSFDKMPVDELRPIRDFTSKQLSLTRAIRTQPREKLTRVITAELDKLIRIGGIHPKFYPTRAHLPATVTNAQIVAGIFVFKDKSDGRETARLAADGRNIELPDGQLSYAEVVPGDDKQMALAGMVAHCNSRNEVLNMSTSDVVGAFPRVVRPPGSVDLYILLPRNLPHSWAGGYVKVKGAIYGLKESSRLFQLELVKVILSAGFRSMPESRMTFVAHDTVDPGLMSVASVVVDDIQNLDNCKKLTIRLQDAMQARFTEITIDDGHMFAGIEYRLIVSDNPSLPRNTVITTQNKYIGRISTNAGVVHMPPVSALDLPDFFEASTTTADLVHADPVLYQHLLGCLTHALQTRPEIRPGVSFLASHNVTPNTGDMIKAIYMLRYIYSTQEVGLVYNAKTTQICAYSDSAFACHENGHSSTGFILCMGPHDAPFVCSAKAQSRVAPDIVSSEYYAANSTCLLISHFRQLASSMGWPQDSTTLYMDSQSAINLAQAPVITKKARHMHASYHYIRELVEHNDVVLVHIPTEQMRVDVITKIMTPSKFVRGRDLLMNMSTLFVQSLCGYVHKLWFS